MRKLKEIIHTKGRTQIFYCRMLKMDQPTFSKILNGGYGRRFTAEKKKMLKDFLVNEDKVDKGLVESALEELEDRINTRWTLYTVPVCQPLTGNPKA